jgi:riboflavin biosynthesis pyrimidine reductase
VRFNFVASVDGGATLAGRSGGLGNAEDQRVLHLLRRLADVVLVGAGTVRTEGYAGALLDEEGQAWRRAQGRTAHPAVAVVSGGLDLDPAAPFFSEAPVRPLVVTTASPDRDRARALQPLADLVEAGRDRLDPAVLLAAFRTRGLRVVHSEGGPTLFGTFLQAGVIDDLCLSVSPMLVGGGGPRIVDSATPPHAAPLRLAHVLRGSDLLLLRYTSCGGF